MWVFILYMTNDAYRAVRQFERLLNISRENTLESSVQEGRLICTIIYNPEKQTIRYEYPPLKE